MFTLPPDLARDLPVEVAEYIPTFRPQRLLTDAQWARCDVAVWTSCASTEPVTREDAKTQMSVTCAFLAFTDAVVGNVDLDEVLTPELVDRFTVTSQGRVSDETRANRAARLQRALRAAAGDAARTVRGPRAPGAAPYNDDELAALTAAATGCVPLRTALAATSAASRPRWKVAGQGPAGLAAGDWSRAGRAAAAADVPLLERRLRATWLQAVLAEPTPLAVLATTRGLSRADLDNAVAHLPTPSAVELQALLRG